MIQSIETNVVVGEDEKELKIDYAEEDNIIYVYLDRKHLFTTDFDGNFKQVVEKIIEKW